jgi:ATP synthase subunit 6
VERDVTTHIGQSLEARRRLRHGLLPALHRLLRRAAAVAAFSMALAALSGGGLRAQDEQGHGGDRAGRTTMQMAAKDFFEEQFRHLMPHADFTPAISPDPERNKLFTFYDVNRFQVGVVLAIVVLFWLVRASFRAERASWIVRVFRGWCLWIRDEMVYPVLGKEHGNKFAPYFIFLFFFLAFLNVVSLIPGSVTATATVFVTGALALLTLLMIIAFGMKEQGAAGFWLHMLVPPGVPLYVVPIMAPVELMSLFVKPFALMMRLFANLLAGHMVLYSFIGMIFVFAKLLEMSGWAYLTTLPSLALAIFVYIIEAFIALVQAYVFTYLSLIFVGQALHPQH